uniref:Uncharacterized protein n=1 Tax=Oryza nivara TaxID=4536 RepID=A0A0E0FGE9_ORYNI
MAAAELSIKLVIDTKAHKVCFAEAGSDFVEFLSSLLCLPVSNIINLLTKEHMVGSIANVFDSVEKLDADHVISNESKEPYLKPMVAPGAFCPLQQLIDAQLNTDTSFFTCEGKLNHYHGIRVACGYFTVMKGSICPKCGYAMEKAMAHVKATGFVVGTARYTVKDDLSIVPASSVSTISLLAQCGVKDLSTLQERTVKIGKEEALEILLASLRTKTVLTDVFLLKKKVVVCSSSSTLHRHSPPSSSQASGCGSGGGGGGDPSGKIMAMKTLSIKLLIDTKAQKVCFAEAGNDVIEFLASLLCLPMSTIINLLTKERMVGSMGNVLDSMEKLEDKHVTTNQSKQRYLSPTAAPNALCPLQQLLDTELNANTSFFTCEGKLNSTSFNATRFACGYFSVVKGSICPLCYTPMHKAIPHVNTSRVMAGTGTYTIKDDLSMTPASSVSSISLLAQCGVKDLTTLQERTMKIGKEEALEILLASLKSKTVLTDVFLPKKKESYYYYYPCSSIIVLDSSPSPPSSLPSQDGGSGSGGHQRRSIVGKIMAAIRLSMKLLIDTKAQKVCFAEAGSDVIEFLSCLLCLPMSTIINMLTKERMVGSMGNVLDSVEKLDSKYVISSQSKERFLSPTVAPTVLCPLQQLLLDAKLNVNASFFTCEGKSTVVSYSTTKVPCGYFSVSNGAVCPVCSTQMHRAIPHVKTVGFVVGTATYTVRDDLSMTPASSVSSVSLLAQCGVKDLSALQERTVKIGKEEALEILLASLKSKTVLTDVFLPKRKVSCKREASDRLTNAN